MTQDKNIVRDRTLVLRVLVPGLHTSLHDKINPNRTTKDEPATSSSSSSPWPTEDASTSLLSGPSMMDSTRGDHQQHQILNLDGVSCIPSSKGSTLWHFRCDGATYPARLVNLPWWETVDRSRAFLNRCSFIVCWCSFWRFFQYPLMIVSSFFWMWCAQFSLINGNTNIINVIVLWKCTKLMIMPIITNLPTLVKC